MGSVLVVNAGSTSLKLRVVSENGEAHDVASLDQAGKDELDAVAHRVVHGGPRLRKPVLIDEEIRREILAVRPLAPLHNAPALRAIEEAEEVFPDLPGSLFTGNNFPACNIGFTNEEIASQTGDNS